MLIEKLIVHINIARVYTSNELGNIRAVECFLFRIDVTFDGNIIESHNIFEIMNIL